MKDLKHKLITLGIIIVWLFACNGGFAQTYDPSKGTVSNKPYAPAQATPTDSRSYYYDGTNFIWRPYQSTTEVLSYLNLAKYRTGQFSIYVNPTGTLNGDGTFTGGTIAEYWFKNGTANGNLVLKTDSTKANQQTLIDTAAAIQARLNLKANQTALRDTAAAIRSNMGGGSGSVSITGNNATGIYVSPNPITGTGSVRNDTASTIGTKAFIYKIRDSMLLEQDTLVISNTPTSGIALAYANLTQDTAFFKRIKSGNATTPTQNADSSMSVDLGGTQNASVNITMPTPYSYTVDGDSADLTLNSTRSELRITGGKTTNDFSLIRPSLSAGWAAVEAQVGAFGGVVNNGSSFFKLANRYGFVPGSLSLTNDNVDSTGSGYLLAYGKLNGVNQQSFFSIDSRNIQLFPNDSVIISKPLVYTSNIHGSFTPYSVIDKAYYDSAKNTGTFFRSMRVVDDADFTLSTTDYTVLIKNNNVSTRTATIPDPTLFANRVIVIINSGTQSVTLSRNIYSDPTTFTTTLITNKTLEAQSDGSVWWIKGIYSR